MNNQKVFILLLIIVLIIFKLYNVNEGFESSGSAYFSNRNPNYFPCDSNSFNSNCTCPPNTQTQRVEGVFPMNYTKSSPYKYVCASKSTPEPNTNVYPNLPE